MKDVETFAIFSRILEVIQDVGITAFSDSQMSKKYQCGDTLDILATLPFNADVGELLVRKVFQAFAKNSLVKYQQKVCGGEEILALRCLHEDYRRTLILLNDWCRRLRVVEAVVKFTVLMRCHLLQPDLLTGESPIGKNELLRFLRAYGRKVLEKIEDADGRSTFMRRIVSHSDEVLQHLHGLMLSSSPDIKALWKSVLVECTCERVEALDDDFTVGRIVSCIQWKDDVVDAFVRMALSPDPNSPDDRVEVQRWCEELEQQLIVTYGRKRIASLWDVIVEYPDSIPTLQDLRLCLLRSADDTLRNELTQTTRQILATRLHRAGTRTEDILAILIGTIHSLSVLLTKNDRTSVIFAIVGDTLEHLKKRKDFVFSLVQAIAHPGSDSALNVDLQNYFSYNHTTAGVEENEPNEEHLLPMSGSSLSMHERPDVLRVLLSAISVTSLVEEYRQVLALQLLSKPIHNFDTTAEEEVLERLKCVFGEDVLAPCVVMIRDIWASRRFTVHMKEVHERHLRQGQASEKRREWSLSLNVLSTNSWPKLSTCLAAGEAQPAPESYNPHPFLCAAMDEAMEEYKGIKANQRLEWILSQGCVSLDITQKNSAGGVIVVTYDLSLFSASLVLFVRDISAELNSPAPLVKVAERMNVKAHVIQQRLSHLFPSILVSADGNKTLSLQTTYVSASNFIFDEAAENKEQPAGLSQDQVKVLLSMMTAMLKARGPSNVNDIFSSMKMFGQFPGDIEDMKNLLQLFVSEGSLLLNEAKLFTLPKN